MKTGGGPFSFFMSGFLTWQYKEKVPEKLVFIEVRSLVRMLIYQKFPCTDLKQLLVVLSDLTMLYTTLQFLLLLADLTIIIIIILLYSAQ